MFYTKNPDIAFYDINRTTFSSHKNQIILSSQAVLLSGFQHDTVHKMVPAITELL